MLQSQALLGSQPTSAVKFWAYLQRTEHTEFTVQWEPYVIDYFQMPKVFKCLRDSEQSIYHLTSHCKMDKYLVAALVSEDCADGEPTLRQPGLRSKLVDFVI